MTHVLSCSLPFGGLSDLARVQGAYEVKLPGGPAMDKRADSYVRRSAVGIDIPGSKADVPIGHGGSDVCRRVLGPPVSRSEDKVYDLPFLSVERQHLALVDHGQRGARLNVSRAA